MNRDHTPTAPEVIVPRSAVPSGEPAPSEAAGEQHRKRLAPASLVPALTLVALQLMKDQLGPVDLLSLLSIGSGGHRPGAQ
jgi:hypothetical protein